MTTIPKDTTRIVLLVGTEKGLFRLTSDTARQRWSMEGPLIAGYEVLHAWIDPRRPSHAYAAVRHTIWGPHIYHSADAGRSWESLSATPQHAPGLHPESLRAIWYLAPGPASEPDTLYAGIDPAGLFVSRDRGGSWAPVSALNEHPSRDTWEPARGGFSLHSIHIPELAPGRMYAAISAGGAYRSDDGGASWIPVNRHVRAENLPQRFADSGHNIHRLVAHPARPDRLYRQCYNGVYRSDDGGLNWVEISAGLPSDFGYALVCEQDDPDVVYVLPVASNHMRTMPEGRLRVYRSADAGNSWQALSNGLPQEHVYVSVLREAMALDDLPRCGVYFGTTSGHLFASPNRGQQWQCIADLLPRILSVKAMVIDDEY
jgi:photosystem II stability/assembly factor-like uncharacterized protein